MTDVFSEIDDETQPLRVSQLRSSMGEAVGAQAGESFMGGVRTLYRGFEYALANGMPPPIEDPFTAVAYQQSIDAAPPVKDIPLEDARTRLKQEGLEQHVKLPDQPTIREPVLDLMIAHGHEKADYDAAVSRGPMGSGALGMITSLGVGMIDPVNAAAFSIPVLGEARWGKMILNAGDSLAARAGVRAIQGAAQGAVGSAALAPADWWLHTRDGQDYTMADALHSVVMGAGMGALAHAGIGGIGDIRARAGDRPLSGSVEDLRQRALAGDTEAAATVERMRGRSALEASPETPPEDVPGIPAPDAEIPGVTPAELPPTHPAKILADLPPAAQEDVVRAAIADQVAGRPVRVGEMLDAAAEVSPRIRESVSLGALPEGASHAGHGPHGPVIDGLQDRPADAIAWLREAKTGEARDVLPMPDREQRVDLISGTEKYGVAHIEHEHPGALDALPELWPSMKVVREDDKYVTLESNAARAVVAKDYRGDPKHWLLTFFELKGREGPGGEPGLRPTTDLRSPLSRYYGGEGAGPADTIAPRTPRVDSGNADTFAGLATREPIHDDPEMVAASKEADATPEPASVEPDKALSAAQKAAQEAEDQFRAIEPFLSDDERAAFNAVLEQMDRESEGYIATIRDGAACLAAAGLGGLA